MGMSGGRGGDLNSEINVTPLVDVMLVLLIIFMVTAPMLTQGVELELPAAEAEPVADTEGKLVLSIDKNGAVFLAQVPVRWEDLETKLAANELAKEGLYIEADKNLPYGTVLQAMAVARKAKVKDLLMLTEPIDTSVPPPAPVPR
jgi:biopolymer transport protein TolR